MPQAQRAQAPIRIFIIDDHPTIIWGLERLIESEQPRMVVVGKAAGSASAMMLMEHAQPDVVLLDLDLGDENGLDTIPELLKKSTARILVLTGVRDASAHEAAIRAGALGVVGKEIASAELLQAIERVHRGELSVDRQTTERLLATISRNPSPPRRTPEEERVASLTARERDIVLSLMRQPQVPLKEAAESLGISERTLRNHLSSIYGSSASQAAWTSTCSAASRCSTKPSVSGFPLAPRVRLRFPWTVVATAPGEPPSESESLRAARLHDLLPFRHIREQKFAEHFRAAAHGGRALREDDLLHARLVQDLHEHGVQSGEQWPRELCGCHDAIPADDLEPRQTGFGDSRGYRAGTGRVAGR